MVIPNNYAYITTLCALGAGRAFAIPHMTTRATFKHCIHGSFLSGKEQPNGYALPAGRASKTMWFCEMNTGVSRAADRAARSPVRVQAVFGGLFI